MPTSTPTPGRKKRGGGGCCGCLIVLILLLVGVLWLARKWAPNHLNRGIAWGRSQAVTRYPVLNRWLPEAPGARPNSVFEPPVAPTASPAPEPVTASPVPPTAPPTPSPAPTATLDSGAPTELVVGTGAEAKLGQTVQIHYGAGKPADTPELFMIGANEVDPALESGVKGMKVGGKRRLGTLEVELVKVL